MVDGEKKQKTIKTHLAASRSTMYRSKPTEEQPGFYPDLCLHGSRGAAAATRGAQCHADVPQRNNSGPRVLTFSCGDVREIGDGGRRRSARAASRMAAVTSPESSPQPRVYFQTPPGGEEGEVPVRKQGRVTVKYDRKELRKRLNLEEWIIERLTELYDCEEEAIPELEIDVDELLDMPSDVDRAARVKDLLVDCYKPTDDFVAELLNKIRGMQKLTVPPLHPGPARSGRSAFSNSRDAQRRL
ncbi:protein phosphatase 1 regulatory subunit 14B isoform X1 [Arapaima gigas]